tara:strand:+ start:2761 stop:4038 length:1278 start_codon:yes stop_codon:yes gene_type:complete
MEDKIYDYAIIGTGLSSLGVLHKISKKNNKIIVVESSNRIIKKNFKSPIYCEEKIPIPISKNFFGKKRSFFELMNYKSYGGNTNHWGGYCCRFNNRDLKKWPINFQTLNKYYLEAEKILNINNVKSQFEDNLLVSQSQIAKNKNKIFNSSDLITKLINNRNIEIKFDELISFKKKSKFFYLNLKKSKNSFLCKKLIVCAGVYATQEILKKSIAKLRFKNVEQAQSFIIPVILKKNSHNFKKDNQIIYNSKTNYGNIYFEIKKDDKLLKKTIKQNMNFFSKLVPNFLLNKIAIVWGFIPSEFSYDYHILDKKIKFINSHNKKIKFKTLKYINVVTKILREKLNLIVFEKLIKLTQFARSYHVGSNIPMSIKKQKYLTTKINGEINLKKYKNLYISGSSVFPNLPSKSHGLTILANSLRIGDHLNNE